MNEQELIQFLKENLRVKATIDRDGDINVTLVLCGENISTDYCSIPENE